MTYRKSLFEKDGKYKFLLFEQKEDQRLTLCESVESPSMFDMSCTPIQVSYFNVSNGVTEQDYAVQRDRLERDGWTFLGETLSEIPIAVVQ